MEFALLVGFGGILGKNFTKEERNNGAISEGVAHPSILNKETILK